LAGSVFSVLYRDFGVRGWLHRAKPFVFGEIWILASRIVAKPCVLGEIWIPVSKMLPKGGIWGLVAFA
jgi:hypothetical protein